jgi:hypothetical protein
MGIKRFLGAAPGGAVRMALMGLLTAVFGMESLVVSSQARADTGNEIVWTATKVQGDVSYREGGYKEARWIPLRTGGLLSALAELRTGTNGRAELSYKESTIIAAPRSEFRLPGPTPKNAVYRVSQKVGTFLYKIKHATRDKFEVQTPFLTTIIKGTIFSVLAGKDGSSVHVTEGAVFVKPSSGNGGSFVRPGQTARVNGKSRDRVIMQGTRKVPGKSTDPEGDKRSENGQDKKDGKAKRGKPVKIVFRDMTGQVASLGGIDGTSVEGAKKGKKADLSQNDSAALGTGGPGNGNNGNGFGNTNAGNNGNGNGNGNGNAGGNGNGLGNGNAGLGRGNSGGNKKS